MRRLYVYYTVAEADLARSVPAVLAMQAALMAKHAGLQAELLRRPEPLGGQITLMECYAGGVTPALRAALDLAARDLPRPRHTEVFESLA